MSMEVAHRPVVRDFRTVECFHSKVLWLDRKLMMGRHSPDFLGARKNVEVKPWVLPWGRAEMEFFTLGFCLGEELKWHSLLLGSVFLFLEQPDD